MKGGFAEPSTILFEVRAMRAQLGGQAEMEVAKAILVERGWLLERRRPVASRDLRCGSGGQEVFNLPLRSEASNRALDGTTTNIWKQLTRGGLPPQALCAPRGRRAALGFGTRGLRQSRHDAEDDSREMSRIRKHGERPVGRHRRLASLAWLSPTEGHSPSVALR